MYILETLLEETFNTVLKTSNWTDRDFAFPTAANMIKVAIGMRRAGKTTFLYQTINQLLAKGIEKSQILMINFEDDRLLPMTTKEMGELIDQFYTLYPQNHERETYLFLDEVQNIPDWHLVIRRIFDTKRVQIYLTGSSAKLLSKEINTSLRGRSLSIEIFPYNFKEYVKAHQLNWPTTFGKQSVDIMQNHLISFFRMGGFPAVQHMPAHEWRDTLQNYVDTVILRDIIERHNVSNILVLKYLTTTLLKNAASPFSINKFYNDIKSQGYQIGKDTLHTYLNYIEDSFLIFTVPLYSESERTQQNIPKKIYAIDNGLIGANTLGTNDIYNKFLENQIYLDLRREQKRVYFYKTSDHTEIDFVTVDQEGNRELIQVTWNMDSPKIAEREQRALDKAMKELGIPGKIVTLRDYLRSTQTN